MYTACYWEVGKSIMWSCASMSYLINNTYAGNTFPVFTRLSCGITKSTFIFSSFRQHNIHALMFSKQTLFSGGWGFRPDCSVPQSHRDTGDNVFWGWLLGFDRSSWMWATASLILRSLTVLYLCLFARLLCVFSLFFSIIAKVCMCLSIAQRTSLQRDAEIQAQVLLVSVVPCLVCGWGRGRSQVAILLFAQCWLFEADVFAAKNSLFLPFIFVVVDMNVN